MTRVVFQPFCNWQLAIAVGELEVGVLIQYVVVFTPNDLVTERASESLHLFAFVCIRPWL